MSISKRTYAEQSFAYEFGRKLKAARTVSNVSQMALADALEVHRNRVSHWEHGEGMVSLQLAMQIVGVLRCDLNTLLPASSFVWGRELPKRPAVRWATLRQVVEERDPALTAAERQ